MVNPDSIKPYNHKQIKNRYETLIRRRNKINDQIKTLQDICLHPNVNKEYKGNTGNYDPTSDCYWIEWKCPDCNKRWDTEQ